MPPRLRTGRRSAIRVAIVAGMAALGLVAGSAGSHAASVESLSDFQPGANGFQFPNFVTSNTPDTTATSSSAFSAPVFEFSDADVYRMMGPSGCSNAGATAENCTPKSIYQFWLEQFEQPEDGQCFGMATLSQLLFNGYLKPPQIDPSYSAGEETYSIPNSVGPQSSDLIHEIGFWFASQGFNTGDGATQTPNSVVSQLQQAFSASGGNPAQIPYVLSLGDHAITPIGVRPSSAQGPGWEEILVYDNNFPNQTNSLYVHTSANYFFYLAGAFWSGTGTTSKLGLVALSDLLPISKGTGSRAAKTLPSMTSVRVADQGAAKLRVRVLDAKGRAVKRAPVRFTSPSHRHALAQIPATQGRFVLEIKNLGRKALKEVTASVIGQGLGAQVLGASVRPGATVRVLVDRPAGSVRVAGSAKRATKLVLDGGRADYTIRVKAAGGKLPAGTSVRANRNRGVIELRLPGTKVRAVEVVVTKKWLDRNGKSQRSTRRLKANASPWATTTIPFK